MLICRLPHLSTRANDEHIAGRRVCGALSDPTEPKPTRFSHSNVAHCDQVGPDVPSDECECLAGLAGTQFGLGRDSVAFGGGTRLRKYS
jgi:hypothetical protein